MKRNTSLALGYAFSLICVLLSVTLVMQRYSYPGEEALQYEIKNGTRVVIDLTNGKIHERLRSQQQEPAPFSAAAQIVPVPSDHKDAKPLPENKAVPTSSDHTAAPLAKNDSPSDPQIPDAPPEAGTQPAPPTVDFRDKGKPVVAVMVKGLGMSGFPTELAQHLPDYVTLGFSPYSPSLDEDIKNAIENGHDVLINLPMESSDLTSEDPGPYSLLSAMTPEDNLRRLNLALSRTVRYAGVYTDQDEHFTSLPSAAMPIVKELKKREIELVYGAGYQNYSFIQLAEKNGYPVLATDAHVNSAIDGDAANDAMNAALESAQKKGFAVLMVASYPMTIKLAEEWMNRVDKERATFVPVSYLLAKNREALQTNAALPSPAIKSEKNPPSKTERPDPHGAPSGKH
ncbi:MAG: divergent polysaccharide deacetylase family protein [Rickettsiales bacterium]